MDLVILFTLLFFLLTVVSLAFIFRKAGQSPFLAFIPVYNIVIWLRIVKKPLWWLIFTIMPYINVFMVMLLIVETLKAFNKHSIGAHILRSINISRTSIPISRRKGRNHFPAYGSRPLFSPLLPPRSSVCFSSKHTPFRLHQWKNQCLSVISFLLIK